MFLVFFILMGRVLVPWYMVTGVFAATKGLEITLLEYRLTPNDLEHLRGGAPLLDEWSRTILDPAIDAIFEVHVAEPGDIQIAGHRWTAADAQTICIAGANLSRPPLVAISLHPDSTYQSLLTAIDAVRADIRRVNGCTIRLTVLSNKTGHGSGLMHNNALKLTVCPGTTLAESLRSTPPLITALRDGVQSRRSGRARAAPGQPAA